jgi:DNA (cytosine-5)-methyltransferase 1
MVHSCPRCRHEFKQKGHYNAHLNRKTPCVSEQVIREEVIRELQEAERSTVKVVDLFSGAGGLTTGFHGDNFKILFGVEHDKFAAQTYSANFQHPMLNKDIRELDADALRAEHGQADIVIGGPPCQGFSMAGKRDTKDPRNSLFMDYLRFVKAFEPKYFVMENVPGILTMKTADGEPVVNIIQNEVKSIGYNLKWKILMACDYGVPQKRRRVIFLGWKEGLAEPSHPEPTHTRETYVCMRDVLLPREDIPTKYYHSPKMIEGFRLRKLHNQSVGKGFGAQFIKDDEPCYTISARYYKDGSDALVRYSDTEIRRLTEKEAARVQSFPDTFVFPVSGVQTYKQIGNAVACKLAGAIGGAILKQFHLPNELGV